jgi:ribonuclease D
LPDTAPPGQPTAVHLLQRQADLPALADQLARQRRFAVDSESDSFHHYREKVCLVQISIPGTTFLLDTLQLDHLDPLLPLFADPSVEKVLHGADYDVRTLGRDYGVRFEQLFDTMIAAQLLGLEAVGLAALLQRHFGVTLDKRWQKADWSRRPLMPEMTRYAADDTVHLLALRDRLTEELERTARLSWLREECQQLVTQKAAPRQHPSCFAVKGAGRLEPRQLAVLQALLDLREEAASAADRPPFMVISTELLLELAKCQPMTPGELAAVPGLTGRLRERLGERLLDAIHRGQAVAPAQWPRRPPSTHTPLAPAQDALLQRLKAVRQRVAAQLGLSPGLVCSNAVMEEIARLPQPSIAQIHERLSHWRGAVLGEEFAKILTEVDRRSS